jgi:hypothetical protein
MARPLQKAFSAGIKRAPAVLLAKLVAPKLKSAGVRDYRKMADRFAEHILANGEKPFSWGDGANVRDIQISFDEDDSRELKRLQKEFFDELPDLIDRVTSMTAKMEAARYIGLWREHRYRELREINGFQRRLEDRWGSGLDILRVLLKVSLDVGQGFHERLSGSRARKNRNLRSALSRLHIRGCQVASEILVLLENGYADGAMARWRTLHEINVVGFVIRDGGDELAKRYLTYDAVEAKKALDQYLIDHKLLGYSPPSSKEMRRTQQLYDAVINEFGLSFGQSYGWAADYLKIKSPRFIDIQKAAGRAKMQSHYKMASYNVHASPRALTFRLGSLNDHSRLTAGATNAGLEEPGQNLAFSLVQTTSLLCTQDCEIDDIVAQKILAQLLDDAVDTLVRLGKTLAREDREIRRALAAEGINAELTW